MPATAQTQAVQIANLLILLAQQQLSIYQQMVILDAAWTDDNAANIIAALATAPQNPDGSLGTADGSANAAHPIDTRVVGLSRALTSTQIGQLKTIMDGIVAYVGGQAVSTQASARPILNVATGG